MGDTQVERGSSAASRREELEIGSVLRRLRDLPGPPMFGVLTNPAITALPALAELSTAVGLAELRRRLGVSCVRAFVVGDRAAQVLGEVALSMSPSDAPRAARLAGLVAFGASELAAPVRQVLDAVAEAGCPIQLVTAGPDAPDPLVLGSRMFTPETLERRLEYLRVAAAVPREGQFVFIDLTGSDSDRARHVVTTLACTRRQSVVEARRHALPIDLLSMLDAADLVVTDSPVMLALVLALGRPALGVTKERDGPWAPLVAVAPDLIVAGHAELAEAMQSCICRAAGPDLRTQLIRGGDALFDRLSDALIDSGGSRLAESVAGRIDDLIDERAALEAVNAGLRQRLARERAAMAGYVRSIAEPAVERTPLRLELARTQREAAAEAAARHEAQAEVERLRAEITRIYSTTTMRVVRPARSLYARLWRRAR